MHLCSAGYLKVCCTKTCCWYMLSDILHYCLQSVMEELKLLLIMNLMHYSHVCKCKEEILSPRPTLDFVFYLYSRATWCGPKQRSESRETQSPQRTDTDTSWNSSFTLLHHMEVFFLCTHSFSKKRKFSFQCPSPLWSCKVRRNCLSVHSSWFVPKYNIKHQMIPQISYAHP